MTRRPVKIFIASSGELKEERKQLVSDLSTLNKQHDHLHLEPIRWETDLESGSYGDRRVQEAINPLLLQADIVVFLWFSKVGIFTLEEFHLARDHNKKVFLYFKTGFSPKNRSENSLYGEVLALREEIENENKSLYRGYSGLADLKSTLFEDLGLYLKKQFPPHPAPTGPEASETKPDPLAHLLLPDDIGLPVAPFPGFVRFKRSDARVFFGRSEEILELVEWLEQGQQKILLFHGQSGAGKSSLLEAGLLPRLEKLGWAVEIRRRSLEKGLWQEMEEARQALTGRSNAYKLLLLDQVEEMITNPHPSRPDEKADWIDALATAWRQGFGAHLLLSFRKEYLAEIQDLLQNKNNLPCYPLFLYPLSREGLKEAVKGAASTPAHREAYNLDVPQSLSETITRDLFPGHQGQQSTPHTAPLLQMTLRKMWDLAQKEQPGPDRTFDERLYNRIRKNNLEEMLVQQLLDLEHHFSTDPSAPLPTIGRRPDAQLCEAVRNGLALDLLSQFVTEERTATSCSIDYLHRNHYDHIPRFKDLVKALKDLFLLTEEELKESHNARLAHDTLADLIARHSRASALPAQRAWAIIESRMPDVKKAPGAYFSDSDVGVISLARPFMRKIPEEVEACIRESEEQMKRTRAELSEKTSFIFETLRKGAYDHLIQMEHLPAIEKFKAAVDVGIGQVEKRNALIAGLTELAYFFSQTGLHFPQAREILELLDQLGQNETASGGIKKCLREQWEERKPLEDLLRLIDPDKFAEWENWYYPKMIPVEGGKFKMGNSDGYPDERPPHNVSLDRFAIAQTPVTFRQFGLFCMATGRKIGAYTPSWGKYGDNPVVHVMWYDAVEFANWLSEQQGLRPVYHIDKAKKDPDNNQADDIFKWKVTRLNNTNGYRLPTEAEWEYAARGGKKRRGFRYAGSDNLDEVGWYWGNSGDRPLSGDWDYQKVLQNNCRTRPVAGKLPNELDLFDMSGNVWEWCWDWYGEDYYKSSPSRNPAGPSGGTSRVLRGGSWSGIVNFCRSSMRYWNDPDSRSNNVGFRLAQD